jgi:hypothetical protein
VEQQQRASIILEEAKAQPQQILNVREAYLDWLIAMKVTDTERLAPEPSGEPDPMEQIMVQNLAREADIAEREVTIKEQKQELERMSMMLKAMKEGAEMNLQLDLTEAQITEKYATAMHKLWEMGMAGDDPIAVVQGMEDALIDQTAAPAALPAPQAPPDPNLQAAPPGTSQGA